MPASEPPVRACPPAAAEGGRVLLERRFERTLSLWLERFSAPRWRGCHLEGWLFEGPAERRAAEQQLAALGVHARLHSAYKPLLHHFVDAGVQPGELVAARVLYPVPESGPARRFALEAYPLGTLLPTGALELLPRTDGATCYTVELEWRDGQRTVEQVEAPNRRHLDTVGQPVLSPTGWLRVGTAAGRGDLIDTAVTTEYEALYACAMQAIMDHPWDHDEPYFERLDIRAELPGCEHGLAWSEERPSTLEAMHEDLYFSALEFFQRHSGRPPGDRRLQPGQIVPDVRACGGAPRLRIALQPFPPFEAGSRGAPAHVPSGLAQLGAAPPAQLVEAFMQQGAGEHFSAPTPQGRTVLGRYRRGAQRPVFLSAGQHANETSGIVGVLRAAQALDTQPGAHFALVALENPDGYALQRELCAHHPGHMHHAARYTALGDDVEYRERAPLWERTARETALRLSGAQLHVNLHGYPAHEWTRPLSGYVPRGFEQWMLPKGFFLILRHHPGWERAARALLEAVCARVLREVPDLATFNARQRALYECHAGPLPFDAIAGIPFTQVESMRDAPVTLITEFPDETLYGEAFRFAHTVQMATALAAVQAWQELTLPA